MINLKQYRPNDVLFWTGAGISMDPPACLPSGYELTKNIVNAFCLDTTWEKIINYLASARIKDASGRIKEIPRLESVLGSIANMLGYNILQRFDDLFNPVPNFFHHFFAYHIKLGGKHVTLNFDMGIENAIKKYYPKTNYRILTPEYFRRRDIDKIVSYIFHLHGSRGDNVRGLGLTIENISKGLHPNSKQFLIDQFQGSKLLVVSGYSGSDFFDVTPFFAELNQSGLSLRGLKVIWVDHNRDSKGLSAFSVLNSSIPILQKLAQSGAECYIWSGPTKDFFNDFINSWNVPNPPFSKHTIPPTFDSSLLEWQRALVTAKIFVSMGLGNEAQGVLRKYPISRSEYEQYSSSNSDLMDLTPGNRITHLFNESLRELGFYKDAISFTNKLYKKTELDKLLFLERRASDFWLMGRIFYARSLYLEALHYGAKHIGLSARFDNLLIECLRGYMQVCRDISYIPLVGKYIATGYFNLALIFLRNKKLLAALESSPYDISHISRIFFGEIDKSIAKNINIPTVLLDEKNITYVFSETDNILGYINTLRSRLNIELSKRYKIQCNDVLHLLALSQKIASYPGVAKASNMVAYVGLLDNEVLKKFVNSLKFVQWTCFRKMIQIMLFIKASVCGALTRRCT